MCVCVCVDGFIVEFPSPPPSVYLVLRANDQVRCFINIHLHYITFCGTQLIHTVPYDV